ncbi:MAG TPA: ferritin-like domain-containing protein [Vicinamibacterales bacterium]
MSSIDSLRALVIEELKDIYDAENRLTKAIPKLVKKSTNDQLKTALQDHLTQTEQHVSRIEQAFEHLDESAKAKSCAGMKGIIEEGDEHAGERYDHDGLRDAAIIGSAQRVEHYEIAAYGTVIAHARLLGLDDVVSLLEETLEEEKAANKKLTAIAESVVNVNAESDEEKASSSQRQSSRRGTTMAGGAESRASAPDRGGRPERGRR